MKKVCKCCNQHQLETDSLFEICPICGWENDPIQNVRPDYTGSANILSLRQHKQKFLKKVINDLLIKNTVDVNEYFSNGSFFNDWESTYSGYINKNIFDYLNESFYVIDVELRDTPLFEDTVKKTLLKALDMLD